MYLLALFLGSMVISCHCKKYAGYANGDDPFFSMSNSYWIDICKGEEVMIGFAGSSKYDITEYKLPNDSIAIAIPQVLALKTG